MKTHSVCQRRLDNANRWAALYMSLIASLDVQFRRAAILGPQIMGHGGSTGPPEPP
jgi:hypothetical protein